MPIIRKLENHIINQIAAGEVLERPAAALKELIENSIDAGSKNITIHIRNGGKTILNITDDGSGIPKDELPLAIERHATSKLDDNDLVNLKHFGFRGEALASMAAVSNLTIRSRVKDDICYKMETSPNGLAPRISPASGNQGTTVEINNLFHSTPARLKFLQSDKSETMAITEATKKMAMANPSVAFTLQDSTTDKMRTLFATQTRAKDKSQRFERICEIMGNGFKKNSFQIDVQRDGIQIEGWVSTPHLVRGSTKTQFAFVNNRSVKDKTITGALRGAVQDILPFGKHLMAALFIEIDPKLVDVNVHPAKEEVRFQNPSHIRGLIVSSLRNGLTQIAPDPQGDENEVEQTTQTQMSFDGSNPVSPFPLPNPTQEKIDAWKPQEPNPVQQTNHPTLNQAFGLVDNTFLLFENEKNLFCLDLKSHLREKIKHQLDLDYNQNEIKTTPLLIPEIFDAPVGSEMVFETHALLLSKYGFNFENFGGTSWLLRERPNYTREGDVKNTLLAIVQELSKTEPMDSSCRDKLHKILVQEAVRTKIQNMSRTEHNEIIDELCQNKGQNKHAFQITSELLYHLKERSGA